MAKTCLNMTPKVKITKKNTEIFESNTFLK